MIEAALLMLAAGALQSPDPEMFSASPMAPEPERVVPPIVPGEISQAKASGGPGPERTSRWFVRAGVLQALYNSRASFTSLGQPIAGGSAHVTDSTTLVFDIGYDVSDKVAVMLTGGIPPRVDVLGEGTISSYGKLGSVRFGPAILTGVYRLPKWHGFRPYVGAGVAHLFILNSHDAAVHKLKVHDNNGFVLQAGLEYRLNRRWELFADYKRLWLNVRAEGELAGAPVRARVTLDPDIVSAGVKFHFR